MGYIAERNGSTRYKGTIVRYKKGYNDIKKGVLDHVGSCKWSSKPMQGEVKTTDVKAGESENRSESPTADNTVDEIKAFLDANGVEYTAKARKDELLELAGEV